MYKRQGQPEAADLAAVDQRTQILLLLLLRAELIDAGAAKRRMYRDGDASAGVHLGHFLHAQRIGQSIRADTAVFLGIGNAEETILLHLLQQLRGIDLFLVHVLRQRLDLCLRKFAIQFLLQQVHFAQLKIHSYLPTIFKR